MRNTEIMNVFDCAKETKANVKLGDKIWVNEPVRKAK